MFPDSEHSPTVAAQGASHSPVSSLISGEFVAPIGTALFDVKGMLSTPVPETAVYENHQPLRPEGKIWIAQDSLVAPPALDMVLAKKSDHRQFGAFVSAAPDRCHPNRTLRFRQEISHLGITLK